MAENLELNIKVDSNVQDVAKGDAAALSKLNAQADRLQGQFAKSWSKIGMAAESARVKEQKAFANSWQKIGMKAETDRIRSIERASKQAERIRQQEAHKRQHESLLSGIKEGTGIGRIATGAFIGASLAEGLIEGIHKAVEVFTDGIKDAFKAAASEEKLRLSYRLILGEKGGKEAMEEAGRLSKLAGFSKSETAEQLRPLLGAGMRGEKLTQSYALATDIAARKGGGSEQVNEAIDAIRRIELKGGISKKQLAGLGLEKNSDFFASMAKSLGKSEKETEKLIEAGKVDSQLIINHLSDLVNKQQGGVGGTGGALYAKTFESRLNRLKNLPEEFFREMVDNPGFQAVSDKMEEILTKLDPESPNGQKIIEALSNAFTSLGDTINQALTPANIDKFANSIKSLVEMIGYLISKANTAYDIVSALAKYSPLGAISKYNDAVIGAATDVAKSMQSSHYTDMQKPSPQVANANGAVTIAQNNVFNGTDPKMVEQLQSTGKDMVSELESSVQNAARPR